MQERIKKVLLENIFNYKEDFDIENNCNKIDDFFKTYKINVSKKQRIPTTTRDNGIINLEEIPFIISSKDDYNAWALLSNGTKILLKSNRKHYENEAEILIMYFLKQLNMACANYDIATYKDIEYLVTPSFLRKNEIILKAFPHLPTIKEGYNLMKKYNGQTQFLKTCFVDRIYGNIDRFPFNYGIIYGNKNNKRITNERLCPLYDNVDDSAVLIRDNKYNFYPSISDDIDDCEQVFNYLLRYEEIMNWVSKTLRKANLYKAADKMKKEKGILIDNKTYQEYEAFFKDSETLINKALENKAFNLKLT